MEKYRPIKSHPSTTAKEAKLRSYFPDGKIINLVDAQSLADTAKGVGLWLFDTELREWHTPEEFVEQYRELPVGSQEFRRFKNLDPIEGVTAGVTQVNTLQEKLLKFVKKVAGYYKNI